MMMIHPRRNFPQSVSNMAPAILLVFFAAAGLVVSCASSNAASAEEYYAIGMAYYDSKKFDDAEKWLIRARNSDKTFTASEYQLGRIAFENSRYTEALEYFKNILKKDPNNTSAMEAAAYTHIKLGQSDDAVKYYKSVVELKPESADSGFNYALLLYAARKYTDAETVLLKYKFDISETKDSKLLFARVEAALKKPEAIDAYAAYLGTDANGMVRCEYAAVLKDDGFYVRAIEEYTKALTEITATDKLKKSDVRFLLAKCLFYADPEKDSGVKELEGAIADGFADKQLIDEFLLDARLTEKNKDEIAIAARAIQSADDESATPENTDTSENAETN
jgi:Tfp pilus assembly protein PilF